MKRSVLSSHHGALVDHEHRHAITDDVIGVRRTVLPGHLDHNAGGISLIWRIHLGAGITIAGQYRCPGSLGIGTGLVDLRFQYPRRTILRESRGIVDRDAEIEPDGLVRRRRSISAPCPDARASPVRVKRVRRQW